jgi:hypothetical protein
MVIIEPAIDVSPLSVSFLQRRYLRPPKMNQPPRPWNGAGFSPRRNFS